MSSVDTDIMLIAGEQGGKTTFLGGLALTMERNNMDRYRSSNTFLGSIKQLLNIDTGIVGEYSVVRGDDEVFSGTDTSVIEKMRTAQYPPPTNFREYYIIRFDINKGLDDAPTVSLSVMDVPGEAQQKAFDRIRDGDFDEEEVRNKFENEEIRQGRGTVESRIMGSKPLNNEEWMWAYLYKYINSNKIIFMINLHKVQKRANLDLRIDSELLEQAAKDRICLLLFTAVDLVDCDPDEYSLNTYAGGGGIMSKNYDTDLRRKLDPQESALSPAAGKTALPLAEKANDLGMDMFGVAVPAEKGTENKIKENDNGDPVLKGFDNVGKWLKQT